MDVRDHVKAQQRDQQTPIYSTSLSVQFRQLIQLLKILLPILVASGIYNYLNPNESEHGARKSSASGSETDAITLPDIPVSKVLKHNLQIVNQSRPWEYAVLTHALLEFQNPEFTVFAGPGFGVDLKKLPGVKSIEPFPGGKLPRAASTSNKAIASGRYDWWGRVKGLRTAKSVVNTRIDISESDGRSSNLGTLMPVEKEGSVPDAAGLGWATLLLGWAGAEDVNNPMVGYDWEGNKRNAYIEAAGRQVRCLFDASGLCNVQFDIHSKRHLQSSSNEDFDSSSTSNPSPEHRHRANKVISHLRSSPQLWSDGIFMFGPFLAGYTVLTQDVQWIDKAIEQTELYASRLSTSISLPITFSSSEHNPDSETHQLNQDALHKEGICHGVWKHIAHPADNVPDHNEHQPNSPCCHDPHVWLTGTAWALAGMTRMLATVTHWHPPDTLLSQIKSLSEHNDNFTQFTQTSRTRLLALITPMTKCLLQSYRHDLDPATDLLRNYLDDGPSSVHNQDRSPGDAAGTALVVSSLYRLAILEPGLISANDLKVADALYAAVGERVSHSTGIVSHVANVKSVPSRFVLGADVSGEKGTSEAQSFVLMMWAARRDCVALGVCRPLQKARGWWRWLSL